jgi:hypothetical protein
VAGVASGTKMQRCSGKAGSLLEEMWAAELAARLKRLAAEMAPCWEWCRSKNSCLFEGCKSVTAKLAPC